MFHPLAYLWAAPTSLLGLALALTARGTGGRWQVREGVLEACGGVLPRVLRALGPFPHGAAAMALGHVILGRDEACLDRLGPHERVHVRQAERWGPLFVPAYLGIGAWLWLTGRHPYHEHPFELEARQAELPPPAA